MAQNDSVASSGGPTPFRAWPRRTEVAADTNPNTTAVDADTVVAAGTETEANDTVVAADTVVAVADGPPPPHQLARTRYGGPGDGTYVITATDRFAMIPGHGGVQARSGGQQGADQMLDLAYFQDLAARLQGAPQIRRHNAALKAMRQEVEPVGVSFNEENNHLYPAVPLLPGEDIQVRRVVHHIGAPGFDFDMGDDGWDSWQWPVLIAQLDDRSMRHVVRGPDGNNDAVAGCYFLGVPGSYDHRRSSGKIKLPKWAFAIERSDGSFIYLEPGWQGVKIDAWEGAPPLVEPPRRGPGRSEGPGTFTRFERLQKNTDIRFRRQN